MVNIIAGSKKRNVPAAAAAQSYPNTPIEYEEAAMVDGYTRFQAFRKIVVPQASTGIAATAVFCFIFAWNEYA
ncbi:unnamed protein product, partial [marine sediment metagenome]